MSLLDKVKETLTGVSGTPPAPPADPPAPPAPPVAKEYPTKCPYIEVTVCPFPNGGCPYQTMHEREEIQVPAWCPLE